MLNEVQAKEMVISTMTHDPTIMNKAIYSRHIKFLMCAAD